MIFKKRNALFGRYPCCDHLNNALRFMLTDWKNNVYAIEEIYQAIVKAGGYFHKDIADKVEAVNKAYWEEQNDV